MSKKKLNSILKGVAGVGVALGGASAFSEGDIVFAAEIEEEQQEKQVQETVSLLGETDASESMSAVLLNSVENDTSASNSYSEIIEKSEANSTSAGNSDSVVESTSGSASDSAKDSNAVVESDSATASSSASESQASVDSNSESTSDAEKEIASEVVSLSNELSSLEEESLNASESLVKQSEEEKTASESASAYSESESLRLSESHASAESQYKAASAELSTAVSMYASESTVFNASGFEDEYLVKLIGQISEAQDKVEAEKQKAKAEGVKLNRTNYYNEADKLANLLIQYKFYQEGYVGEIEYSDWHKDGKNGKFDDNYVEVHYTDPETKKLNGAYFDYVNSDKDTENDGAINWRGKHEWNNSEELDSVDYITVLIKEPKFSNTNSRSNTSLTYKVEPDGTISYSIHEGKKERDVQSVELYVKDGVQYYDVTYSDGSGSKTETFKFNQTFTDKGTLYFSEKQFNEGKDKYHEKRSELTSTEKRASEAKRILNSTSEENGLNSVNNSKSVAESAATSSVGSGNTSTSRSVALSESLKKYHSDSEVIAKKSESISKKSDTISTSASASEAKENSESTSTSASDSLSKANSLSVSNSASMSNSFSDANSTSKSTSTSTSESASTSTSESISASQSASISSSQSNAGGGGGGYTPSSGSESNASTSETSSGSESSSINNSNATEEDNEIVDIPEEDTPLGDNPDGTGEGTETTDTVDEGTEITDIEDEEVPLGVIDTDDTTSIPDEDVPLSDNPQTGDAPTLTWFGAATGAVAGLFGIGKGKSKDKKKK